MKKADMIKHIDAHYERQRLQELKELFRDVDEDEQKIVEKLLEEVVFLEDQMMKLKKMPFISVNPRNPAMQKTTPAAKLYKESSQSYMNAVRILLSIIRKVETTAQDELMKRLEEFA